MQSKGLINAFDGNLHDNFIQMRYQMNFDVGS